MPIFIDQTERAVNIIATPKRIISCVPSQTELLFDLGLSDIVVGTTKFCIHPAEARSKAMIGGTKNLNIEKIVSLQPDLIIANKEENERSQIAEIEKKFPVWVSDVKTIASANKMINEIGRITNRVEEAASITQKIEALYSSFGNLTQPKRVVYLIWQNPIMTIGHDTFINDMLQIVGFDNCFARHTRYPVISEQELIKANPDIVFLSSEPYPFSQKQVDSFQKLIPQASIMLVNGEFFSWYGTRLIAGHAYLKELVTKA